mmetsp:Transcript_2493/g.5902  ORF Transcript_2493/g.5902 Transcript_2493/m.5902 type:complete len:228 (-) Transcript_2493:67-750(-)
MIHLPEQGKGGHHNREQNGTSYQGGTGTWSYSWSCHWGVSWSRHWSVGRSDNGSCSWCRSGGGCSRHIDILNSITFVESKSVTGSKGSNKGIHGTSLNGVLSFFDQYLGESQDGVAISLYDACADESLVWCFSNGRTSLGRDAVLENRARVGLANHNFSVHHASTSGVDTKRNPRSFGDSVFNSDGVLTIGSGVSRSNLGFQGTLKLSFSQVNTLKLSGSKCHATGG